MQSEYSWAACSPCLSAWNCLQTLSMASSLQSSSHDATTLLTWCHFAVATDFHTSNQEDNRSTRKERWLRMTMVRRYLLSYISCSAPSLWCTCIHQYWPRRRIRSPRANKTKQYARQMNEVIGFSHSSMTDGAALSSPSLIET